MIIKRIMIKIMLVKVIMNSIEQKKIMLMKVGVENYINNYEQGGMQLDPHPHKDKINTPTYQVGNSNF